MILNTTSILEEQNNAVKPASGKPLLSIAHVVNPCLVPQTSDLSIAQPITFESMRRAAVAAKGKLEVQLYSVQFQEDQAAVPDFLTRLPDLVGFIEHTGKNSRNRKLPFLKEILDRLYEHAVQADYLIYTNVDIALQPHFYQAILDKISQGYDAFVINRRTISNRYTRPDELEEMAAERGQPHPGFDCFIFKRRLYPQFELGEIAIGIPQVANLLLLNLAVSAHNFQVFKDEFLTFHIGDDGQWRPVQYRSPAKLHNRRIAIRYMLKVIRTGPKWQHRQLALDRLIMAMRYGNPWFGPLGILKRKISSFHKSR